jgi:hypothetical protein
MTSFWTSRRRQELLKLVDRMNSTASAVSGLTPGWVTLSGIEPNLTSRFLYRDLPADS